MTTYSVVLFLHILFVLISFGAAAVLHTAMFQLRGATTAGDTRLPAQLMKRMEPLFPVSALLFFLAGAYLVSEQWEWRDGWIVAAIIGLVIMEVLGGTILKKAGERLHRAAFAVAPEQPIDGELRDAIWNPTVWVCAHLATCLGIGILFVMVTKPSGVASVVVLIIASAIGALSALPFSKPRIEAAAS